MTKNDASSEAFATDSQGSFQAAIARTATRSLALYFSRPVRLFRPPKVSGWHSLKGLAAQDGASLTPAYLSSLVKNQGFAVIGKHFVPPIVVNGFIFHRQRHGNTLFFVPTALLGTVLWASYAEASNVLTPHIGMHPTAMAAMAGALAGGTQALVSAPVENVRLLVEGGTSHNSWSHAWKEVFRGSPPLPSFSRHDTVQEMRQVKNWMKEVGDMAGRGWHGLGYTLGKDVTGKRFAAFFAIFDITRRIALKVRSVVEDATRSGESAAGNSSQKKHLPQLLQGVTLVGGGVVAGLSYEIIGRPWDWTRHAARLSLLPNQEYRSPLVLVTQKIQQDGFFSLFRDPAAANVVNSPTARSRIYSVFKTLARVGPWGVGFLVYQAYDSGFS